MGKLNKKAPFVFRIGMALLCIWLISAYFVSAVYARYSISASGSSSTGVAVIVAAASGSGDAYGFIDPAAGNSFNYTVTVSNEENGKVSDVSLEYTIYINLPENFPLMDIAISGTELDTEKSISTRLAFRSSDILTAGTSTINEHIVSFTGTDKTIGVFSDMQVSINVIVEQVD